MSFEFNPLTGSLDIVKKVYDYFNIATGLTVTVPENVEYDVNDDLTIVGTLDVKGRVYVTSPYTITKVRTTAATYTMLGGEDEIFANTDSNAVTVNLIAGYDSKKVRIVNTGTSGNDVTVTPNGSENLLGANSSFTLADSESLIIVYDGVDGWF